MVWYSMVCGGMVEVWYGMIQYEVWNGGLWCVVVGYGMVKVWYGGLWYGGGMVWQTKVGFVAIAMVTYGGGIVWRTKVGVVLWPQPW